jgi:hypothetical protein
MATVCGHHFSAKVSTAIYWISYNYLRFVLGFYGDDIMANQQTLPCLDQLYTGIFFTSFLVLCFDVHEAVQIVPGEMGQVSV